MQERKGKRKMSLNSVWETAALFFLGLVSGIIIAGGLFAFVVKVANSHNWCQNDSCNYP